MLAGTPVRSNALADLQLLERVVKHKQEFYYSQWARYDLAVPGTFRLLPPPDTYAELARDYAAMSVMLFGEPPSFASLMTTLGALKAEINRLRPPNVWSHRGAGIAQCMLC